MAETSPRVLRLLHDLRGGRAHVVDDFWQEVKAQGTPLVEAVDDDSALVTFLWRGDAAYTATAFGVDVVLRRLDGTDLWYGSQRLPTDLRTLYYLRHDNLDVLPRNPDGAGTSHVDTLNRHLFRFPADRHDLADYPVCLSLLELPSAPVEPWSRPLPGVARGSLLTTSIRTIALGGRRRIVVYRPAGKPKPVALLVVFDGFHSRTVLRIPTTLDNLIAAGRIPPTMALFVTTPSGKRRDTELRPRRALRDFVVRELLPWARHRWCISDDPQARIVAGASLGALAAAYVGMVAPWAVSRILDSSSDC